MSQTALAGVICKCLGFRDYNLQPISVLSTHCSRIISSSPLLPPPFLPFLLHHLLTLFFPSSFSPLLPFLPSLLLLLLSSPSSPPPFFLPRGAFGTTISLPSTTLLLKTSTYYTSVETEEEEGKKFGAEFWALKWWFFQTLPCLHSPLDLESNLSSSGLHLLYTS